ncbi:MAG: FAD-binding protein [Bacteroidales bacterium]|nr:FAD-binding protein [Bacteroidales bacterium]
MKEFEIAKKVGRELTQEEMAEAAAKAMGIPVRNVACCRVVRRSIDSRGDILYRYRIEAYRQGEVCEEYRLEEYKDVSSAEPVIVVGAGPAGLFAALKLLTLGLKPIILERGQDVHARKADVAALSTTGVVNRDSNYCFGEGGAGTFSDGKLFTRSSKRGDIREVLHQLVAFGADPDILINAHPHIGSDRLPEIVENIRHCIVEHGGEYHFGTKVVDLRKNTDGTISVFTAGTSPADSVALRVQLSENQSDAALKSRSSSSDIFTARNVILATGHSARDIYNLLHDKGLPLQAKGFALGVRVEHPQHIINQIQYHGKYQNFFPTAEYSFVMNYGGRGVFSFCMCPGGILVPSMTDEGEVVLNGMSNSRRNGKLANSGVVVSVEPGDIPEYDRFGELSLMHFQRDVEQSMFRFSGSIKAPAQRMMDFCRRIPSATLPATTYHPGVIPAPLHELLPEHVYSRLKPAFPDIGRKMKGYYTNDALVLGVESRTSSPVRIPRDPVTLEYTGMSGLYPCGEGAGYSGGIVSSALDGINSASAIATKK